VISSTLHTHLTSDKHPKTHEVFEKNQFEKKSELSTRRKLRKELGDGLRSNPTPAVTPRLVSSARLGSLLRCQYLILSKCRVR
jgi:hypothetical protein